MEAIYAEEGESLDRPRRLVREAATHLRAGRPSRHRRMPRSLSSSARGPPVPVIDPTWNLARAAVRCALATGSQLGARRSLQDGVRSSTDGAPPGPGRAEAR
jgi:hypothetical protein